MELASTAWTLIDFETDMGVIPALAEDHYTRLFNGR